MDYVLAETFHEQMYYNYSYDNVLYEVITHDMLHKIDLFTFCTQVSKV